jgi:hypothetical protein
MGRPIDEIWDELDDEERATVGPATRIRLGLDRPMKVMSVSEWEKRKREGKDA